MKKGGNSIETNRRLHTWTAEPGCTNTEWRRAGKRADLHRRSDYFCIQTEHESTALCCCRKGRCISRICNEKDAVQNLK